MIVTPSDEPEQQLPFKRDKDGILRDKEGKEVHEHSFDEFRLLTAPLGVLKQKASTLKTKIALEKMKEANEYIASDQTSRWEWVYEDHGHGHHSMRRADRCMAKPVHEDGLCDCFDRRPKPSKPWMERMKDSWQDFWGGEVVRKGKLRSKEYAEQLEQLEKLINQRSKEEPEPEKVAPRVNKRRKAVEATKKEDSVD